MGETTAKKPDYLVLVNEDNRLPDNFADTIELIPTDNLDGEHFEIEKNGRKLDPARYFYQGKATIYD